MSRKTRVTLPCAAPCSRLELKPSRLAGAVGVTWLLMASGAVMGAAALPWPVRLGVGMVVLIGSCSALARFVGLRGAKAIRAVEWSPGNEIYVHIGNPGRRLPAIPVSNGQRLGTRLWIVRFT